jgi:alkylation response protein AidB-like acyl-CoA dehydrogenase
VFGRPIGQNQGVAHPLAKCWAELEAANLMAFKAAALYDAGREWAEGSRRPSTWAARPASTPARRR